MIIYHTHHDERDERDDLQESSTQESLGLMTTILYGPLLGVLLLLSMYVLFADRQYSLACGTWYNPRRFLSRTWIKRFFILVFATLILCLQVDAVTLSLYVAIVYCTLFHDFLWRRTQCPDTASDSENVKPHVNFSAKEWASIQRSANPVAEAERLQGVHNQTKSEKEARLMETQMAQDLRTQTVGGLPSVSELPADLPGMKGLPTRKSKSKSKSAPQIQPADMLNELD